LNSQLYVNAEDLKDARVIWNYQILNEPVMRNADAVILLGSFDLCTAKVAAGLILSDFSDTLIICGSDSGRGYEILNGLARGRTSAEILAEEVEKYGVDYELVKQTNNTGEDIVFSYNLLKSRGKRTDRIIGVHMPSAERRDKAAFEKQWPSLEKAVMVSPRLSMEEYQHVGYMGLYTWQHFIEDLLGDFQRTFVFSRPEFGFQVPQAELPPQDVLCRYQRLVSRGFTGSLLVKNDGDIYPVGDFFAGELRENRKGK
jgi:hypothetical protein